MAALRGWKRLPGRAERYIDPSGKEVSRRQYENARARQSGWRSWSQYQRARKTDEFRRFKGLASGERNLTRRDFGPNSEFSRLYTAAGADQWSHRADGPFAKFLVFVGARAEDDWWDVGDTPQGGK